MDGMTAAGFEPVRDAFAGCVGDGGASLAVWCDGRWVVDLAAGRWRPGSIAQAYSVVKPFAAVCALRLVQRGTLDLDAPVRAYWPGFTADATVRQVLSHQAGVVALDQPAPTGVFYDWDRLCGLLAAQPPCWQPGTAHGESALFYGHLVGELVRRVDGRGLGRFLREEVCGPLGLDFAVGLDAAAAARVLPLTGLDRDFSAGRTDLWHRAVANPPGALDPAVVNGAAWRAAEIPAVNGHGTARAVAGFYAALLSGAGLDPGLLAEAVTAQCSGPDRVVGADISWGLGFALDDGGYGMAGLGGSIGWADPGGRYALGYVTADLGISSVPAENALRDCLGLAPLPG
jgi:CubicO group peptidase (beta-lactamase class C family)